MSRSGYADADEEGQYNLWRGTVASALRGKRGQAFLKEMKAALDALPVKELISEELQEGDAVCAIGSVGRVRGVDMSRIDPDDFDVIAAKFNIASPMAREIMFMNDEGVHRSETPAERYVRMRKWVESQIVK